MTLGMQSVIPEVIELFVLWEITTYKTNNPLLFYIK